eukprot:PhF_6_TR42678/c0_g1_i1/m.64348/K12618/XRN1, SEP1, KEM1; 5'-3' exoribonuclease 1
MGIPRYARWLIDRYPCILTLSSSPLPVVDNVYIDMNNLIHDMTHGQTPNFWEVSLPPDEAAKEICNQLSLLLELAAPRKRIVLAVDGVAPRAKMNQQRKRRFRVEDAAIGAQKQKFPDAFNVSSISPGTEFMDELHVHLKQFIRKMQATHPVWKRCAVTYSSHRVPGEGEHKIMKFIRETKTAGQYQPNEVHFMYGLDADLIMLALATHEPHFILFREVDVTKEDQKEGVRRHSVLHINALRECLALEVTHSARHADMEKIIDDFIVLCMLIGNDFLPCVPMLHVGSLAAVLEEYSKTLYSKGKYLCDGNVLNWDHFLELAQAMMVTHDSHTQVSARRAKDMAITCTPEDTMDTIKSKYYKSWMMTTGDDTDEVPIRDIVQSYLHGVSWVLEYYFIGCTDWRWFYKYHGAPFLSDMVSEIPKIEGSERQQVKTPRHKEPFIPLEQLLLILPPESADLIRPKNYQVLLTSANSPLRPFIPDITSPLRKEKGHYVLCLPSIPEAILDLAVQSVGPPPRNVLHSTVTYVGGNIQFKFPSDSTWLQPREFNRMILPGTAMCERSPQHIVTLFSYGETLTCRSTPNAFTFSNKNRCAFTAKQLRSMVGQVVQVGFQQIVRAKIQSIWDDVDVFTDKTTSPTEPPNQRTLLTYGTELDSHIYKLKKRYALHLSKHVKSCLLSVHRCVGVLPDPTAVDGQRQLFSPIATTYPSELLRTTRIRDKSSVVIRDTVLDTTRLLKDVQGQRVVLKAEVHMGRVGTIQSYNQSSNKVTVLLDPCQPSGNVCRWGYDIPISLIAQELNISSALAYVMCGGITGKKDDNTRFTLGLQIHSRPSQGFGSEIANVGYGCFRVSPYEDMGHYKPPLMPTNMHNFYIQNTQGKTVLSRLNEFVRVPNLIQYLEENIHSILKTKNVSIKDLLQVVPESEIDRLSAFSSAHKDCSGTPWPSFANIESDATYRTKVPLSVPSETVEVLFNDVVFSSCPVVGQEGSWTPVPTYWEEGIHPGDRVAYAWKSSQIEVGAKGTVVSYEPRRQEAIVLFDDVFSGGTKLRYRLSSHRGYRCTVHSLLRLKPMTSHIRALLR